MNHLSKQARNWEKLSDAAVSCSETVSLGTEGFAQAKNLTLTNLLLYKNLVLSNELIKVELPPWKI